MNIAEFLLKGAADDSLAIIESSRSWTYADLRSATAVLVAALDRLALPKGSPVAIAAPNGFFWVSSYLAVLASGLVAVPLPVRLPADELLARLEWLGSQALFVGGAEKRGLSDVVGPGVALLSEELVTPVAGTRVAPYAEVDPDSDAVYMFTSGTTGAPQAVRITHRNIEANTSSIIEYLGINDRDRMLVVLPFSYVFGASLLHSHLRMGASLVIQNSFVFPESIVEKMISAECTGFAGVPSTFHLLLRNSSFRRRSIPRLRTIQQAGGKLSPVLIQELAQCQPQARIFVMYGQTEATARLSYLPPEELLNRLGSIGKGIPGVSLRVLDESGEPVEVGQIGEIHAWGENVSPGYLNDPAATAEKMGGRDLRTGDLAVVDGDGFIYIVDRANDVIKSWGFRISSQEVEATAMQLPDLVHAAAIGVPDAAAGERIELAVVVRPGSVVTAEDVLAHCRLHLARHMVPERVHFLERLPLNDNGKVSKRELRALLQTEETS